MVQTLIQPYPECHSLPLLPESKLWHNTDIITLIDNGRYKSLRMLTAFIPIFLNDLNKSDFPRWLIWSDKRFPLTCRLIILSYLIGRLLSGSCENFFDVSIIAESLTLVWARKVMAWCILSTCCDTLVFKMAWWSRRARNMKDRPVLMSSLASFYAPAHGKYPVNRQENVHNFSLLTGFIGPVWRFMAR